MSVAKRGRSHRAVGHLGKTISSHAGKLRLRSPIFVGLLGASPPVPGPRLRRGPGTPRSSIGGSSNFVRRTTFGLRPKVAALSAPPRRVFSTELKTRLDGTRLTEGQTGHRPHFFTKAKRKKGEPGGQNGQSRSPEGDLCHVKNPPFDGRMGISPPCLVPKGPPGTPPEGGFGPETVSYTHLTLPTIYSV